MIQRKLERVFHVLPRPMTTLIATLGFAPSAILPSITENRVRRGIVFYYGRDSDVAKPTRDVKRAFASLGLQVDLIRLSDGYDFASCVEEIYRHAQGALQQSSPDEDVVFDVTGGTKIMSIAAFTVAWVLGKRVVYNEVHPEEGTFLRERKVPIEGLQDFGAVGEQSEKVLNLLLDAGEQGLSPDELRERFGAKSPSAINHHIAKLEAKLAASREYGDTRRDVVYKATPAGRVLSLVLKVRRRVGNKLQPPSPAKRRVGRRS